jgi:hypothetical protein
MLNNTFARIDISLRKGNAAVLTWGGRNLSSLAYFTIEAIASVNGVNYEQMSQAIPDR